MENKDFDKLFARKMQGLPPASASLGGWYALQEKLAARKSRRAAWLKYALLALLLLMALSNGWMWYHLQKGSAIPAAGPEASMPAVDTLIRHIVYQYDTIVRKIYVTEYDSRPNGTYSLTGRDGEGPRLQPHARQGQLPQENRPETTNGQDVRPEGPTRNQELQAKESGERHPTLSAEGPSANEHRPPETAPYSAAEAFTENEPGNTNESELPKPQIKPARRALFSAPEFSFFLGNGLPAGNGVREGQALELGMQFSTAFAPHFRAWAEVSYQRSSLESDNPAIAELAESPYSPSEYELRHWEGSPQALGLGLGLRYVWNPIRGHWQPAFSSGFITSIPLPYTVNIEYHHNNAGPEIHWAGEAEHARLHTAWLSSLGLAYKVNNRVSAGAEGLYRLNLTPSSGLWQYQLGFRLNGTLHF
ncbi:MAG: hypothetical protein KDC66_19215 [Phaeodactylibacter sp.]|nr:hypothetical protein [Phaeodactylibacter sp.]